MTKDELRKKYLAKRLALSEKEHDEQSIHMANRFFHSLDLSGIGTLHIYLPIEAKREPDTWLIINRVKKNYPNVRLVVPKMEEERVESFFFEGCLQLEKNKWGILEPQYGVIVREEEMDMVIVPLLAFDKQGHRVGYGKGYYDRFLKLCRPDCIKVGLSFFEPEKSILTRAEDVMLNVCVTAEKFYSFSFF